MTNDKFNELKQFSERDERMIRTLRELSNIEQIKIRHVDFHTRELTISIVGHGSSFDDVMNSVMFCCMTKRMKVNSVDFDTGEIKVVWLPEEIYGLNMDEIDLIRQNKKIHAIKAVRERKGLDLAGAKNLVEAHWNDIVQGKY